MFGDWRLQTHLEGILQCRNPFRLADGHNIPFLFGMDKWRFRHFFDRIHIFGAILDRQMHFPKIPFANQTFHAEIVDVHT